MQMSAWVRKPQDGGAATLTQLTRPACQWKKLLSDLSMFKHTAVRKHREERDLEAVRWSGLILRCKRALPSLTSSPWHLLFLPPELMFPHSEFYSPTYSWKLGPNSSLVKKFSWFLNQGRPVLLLAITDLFSWLSGHALHRGNNTGCALNHTESVLYSVL